ncbi:MAG: 4-(cytidine 5'-diphospho)-2-C-methyl-D-erythritol kinase [Vulcanimicrobiota bacterium]
MITYKSHAKVNLYLRVGACRADGFHEVQTLLQAISLSDELGFRSGEGGMTLSTDPGFQAPPLQNNLIYRAYEAVCRHTAVLRGVEVTLKKTIPVGGGLGGGSSNACTTILALNKLWNLGLSKNELLSIALSLGSDVPFFLCGGTAYAEGRGERITPLDDINSIYMVLVKPPFSISTVDAYRWFDEAMYSLKIFNPEELSSPPDPEEIMLFNSFEEVLFPRFPLLREIKESLLKEGCKGALLSGSGSTVFGITDTEEKASSIAGAIRGKGFGDVYAAAAERREFCE